MPFPKIITDLRPKESSHLAAPRSLGRKEIQAFMPDYYHAPALALSALLLPAFGYLYWRFRDTRTLLWFLGFVFALVSMTLRYIEWPWSACSKCEPLDDCGRALTACRSVRHCFLRPCPLRAFAWGGIERPLCNSLHNSAGDRTSLLLRRFFTAFRPAVRVLWIFPVLGTISLVIALLWGAAQAPHAGLAWGFVLRP